jgi:pimeloyl-ACP methyl ester carboxylesterase
MNDIAVAAADDVMLRGLEWAGGDRRPLLLVHGLASNCRTWTAVGRRLHRASHPVVAIDLRGHGRSDKPDEGYDFASLVADLVAVLDELGWAAPIVAGQSTGGNLAVELAHRHPERVAGVVGVDGGAIELQRQWPAWDDCVEVLAPPRLEGARGADIEAMIRKEHPDWPDEGVETTLANFEMLADGMVRPWLTFDRHLRILRALWEHRPSTIWPGLQVPVLLVPADSGNDWSGRKRVEIDAAASSNPLIDARWFSPADHDIHVQFPDELADVLHEWDRARG